MNNAEVLIKFKGDVTDEQAAQKQVQQDFEKTQKTGELAIAGITAAVDTMVASLVNMGVNYNAQIETYLTRLETLTGSADEANSILNQIKQDALATPFEVSSLTQAESLLLATGLSAEDARADILALGDAIAASGGGNAELSRMAVNMQQIKNVGKASALDIKQFAYAGIDIYGLLADSMGVTREEASQMEVTYGMLSGALQKASKQGGKYYGAMEKQSKTYAGATSNLKESFEVFAGSLSEDVFNAIKDIIPALTDMFNWLTENKDIVMAIAVPLLTFINIFAGFMAVQKAASILKGLWAVMSANPIGLIVAAIAGLVAGFSYLWTHCEGFRNFFIGMWEGIKKVASSIWDFIKPIIDKIGEAISEKIEKIKALFENVKGVFQGVVDFVAGVFTGNWSRAWNGVKNIFSNIVSGFANIFKTPLNWIIDGINVFIRGINKIHLPNWKILGEFAGKGFNIGEIPRLATGTNYVPQDTLAVIHQGEAVVPKKFNPYANGVSGSLLSGMNNQRPIIYVYNDLSIDPIGQVVNNIKTFSGGAKNDYNYGAGV